MQPFLLDSHIILWMRYQPFRLSEKVIDLLQSTPHSKYYSVVTPWELDIKRAKGGLNLPETFFSTLPTLGMDCLPILESHITRLRQLPPLHRDPFDRILVAQAIEERLTLITADKTLAEYGVNAIVIAP